jgi:alpha-tubulin suppressor-like RCC1 family protein
LDNFVKDGYTEYFSFGVDTKGQLGHGKSLESNFISVPKSLSFDILIAKVSCGGSHTILLSKKNEIFTIGSN